jgi:hypothetical protein
MLIFHRWFQNNTSAIGGVGALLTVIVNVPQALGVKRQ